MISSEVQRTLVKSPPELWAEISDPAALARHLGEFGEIRITRVEPEQRVEWEAGDTSGSVVIKPSGWGTKVKLTVTRQSAETASEADAQVDAAADGTREADVDAEATPVSETVAQPALDASGEPAPESDAEPEPVALDADAPQAEADPNPEPGPEPAPAPAPDDGASHVASHVQPGADVDADTAAEPAWESKPERPQAPEPRRSFFARLFRRRRTSPAVEPIDEPEALRDTEPESAPPARYNALEVWASQIEGDDTAQDPIATANTDAASEREAEGPEVAPSEGPEVAPSPHAQAPLEASPSAPESPDAGPDEPDEAAPGDNDAPADISAEIKQAEEVAAEEVTAVLSGVLDRLGAAHHRPFSRA